MFTDKKQKKQKFLQRSFRDPNLIEKVGQEARIEAGQTPAHATPRKWDDFKVILDEGENGYAIAIGEYNGKRVCGIRWNGFEHSAEDDAPQSAARVGTPMTSSGGGQWFILPGFLTSVVIDRAMDEQGSWDWAQDAPAITRK